jgi:uncharacterized protein (DUF362 family)
MFGCTPGKEKAVWHFARGKDPEAFSRMLIGIYRKVTPILNIIDGIIAMQGAGPLNGTPKHLGLIAAGQDPIACEYLCCKLTGIDPASLPILTTAKLMDFGIHNLDQVEILGDPVSDLICTDFEQPERIPIHFPLPRIIKSVTKQIFIKAKAGLKIGGVNND